MKKIYLDENMSPQLAKALDLIQQGINVDTKHEYQVLSTTTEIGVGIKDTELLPQLSGSYFITKDKQIYRRSHERVIYQENNVGVFFIPSDGLKHIDITQLLVKHWSNILTICKRNKTPFAFRLAGKNGKFQELADTPTKSNKKERNKKKVKAPHRV